MNNSIFSKIVLLSTVFFVFSCSKDDQYVVEFDDANFETSDWSESTHAKGADLDYDEVFSDNEVKRFDFVISPERWQGMLDDMEDKYGSFGSSGGRPGLVELDENPIFVPGDVYYNGKQWYKVGLRFKGNSSLQSSWGSGILKLSFKMDFDEFEDQYPQIEDQRFYGFKKFSLKNNYNDPSQLREKVASDIFRNAGVAASRTAFYTLYVDHGDGPEYFGLYTLVEEVDNTVIKTQFVDDEGNVYKPDGDAASFALGSFDESELEKKTNEEEADFSDVQSLYDAIHMSIRTTRREEWRSEVEAVFDTDNYLKYLAVNTVIQNWDTYGRMTHNYYLYNNPENGLLTWIPWDNNEAFQTGKNGGAPALDFSDVTTDSWPLIGYFYADAIYRDKYETYLREVVNGPFNSTQMSVLYTDYATLVEPYVTSERAGFTFSTSSGFQSSIATLKAHAEARRSAVLSYLN